MARRYLILIFVLLAAVLFSSCLIEATINASTKTKPAKTHDDKARVMLVITLDNPELIVIPGTYVYWFWAGDSDVYFYGGVWWRFWGNAWYRSGNHKGGWVRVDVKIVPFAVRHLPSNWKSRQHGAPRVRWYDARDHWGKWERDHYWHNKKGWK